MNPSNTKLSGEGDIKMGEEEKDEKDFEEIWTGRNRPGIPSAYKCYTDAEKNLAEWYWLEGRRTLRKKMAKFTKL